MAGKNIVLGALAAVCVACAPDQPAPTAGFDIAVPLLAVGGNTGSNLETHLTGDEEVLAVAEGAPHPRDSRAQGQAIFRVSDDGSTADFKLISTNIDNVIMAHIHCGRVGANGPIRMWLFPVIGPSGAARESGLGRESGVLAEGTFSFGTITCPASAVGTDMPLLDAIRGGLTYVNVHTNDGVGSGNSGPGDFPGGEIRGQIDHPGGGS